MKASEANSVANTYNNYISASQYDAIQKDITAAANAGLHEIHITKRLNPMVLEKLRNEDGFKINDMSRCGEIDYHISWLNCK